VRCEEGRQGVNDCLRVGQHNRHVVNDAGVHLKREFGQGFTLIEMAIVLVIIGLIVGGIMVGQTLINAATVRSQATQIEKYNQAVNTFRGKYGYLPGDMPPTAVQQFGFTTATARNGGVGRGNGDGILGSGGTGTFAQWSETLWFWEDLSANSGLISETFNTATSADPSPIIGAAAINQYVPLGKIGYSTFVMVGNVNSINYYLVTAIGSYGGGCGAAPPCIGSPFGYANTSYTVGIPSPLAYALDSKIDDGLPLSGSVQFGSIININYLVLGPGWPGGACYNTTTNQYYTNSGTNVCPLAFQFQ
jgi:prepilin-type N-terminal cleavage/methylation domain-containing protein